MEKKVVPIKSILLATIKDCEVSFNSEEAVTPVVQHRKFLSLEDQQELGREQVDYMMQAHKEKKATQANILNTV